VGREREGRRSGREGAPGQLLAAHRRGPSRHAPPAIGGGSAGEREGERVGGRGLSGLGKEKIKNSDMWVPQHVVGIERRYREWMGVEKLNIE